MLERLRASTGWQLIDEDGYKQLQSHARLLDVTVEKASNNVKASNGDLVVAFVDVLKAGQRQPSCRGV